MVVVVVAVVVELVVCIEYNKNRGLNQFFTVACSVYHEAILGNLFGCFVL